jgi:hypothetical protein
MLTGIHGGNLPIAFGTSTKRDDTAGVINPGNTQTTTSNSLSWGEWRQAFEVLRTRASAKLSDLLIKLDEMTRPQVAVEVLESVMPEPAPVRTDFVSSDDWKAFVQGFQLNHILSDDGREHSRADRSPFHMLSGQSQEELRKAWLAQDSGKQLTYFDAYRYLLEVQNSIALTGKPAGPLTPHAINGTASQAFKWLYEEGIKAPINWMLADRKQNRVMLRRVQDLIEPMMTSLSDDDRNAAAAAASASARVTRTGNTESPYRRIRLNDGFSISGGAVTHLLRMPETLENALQGTPLASVFKLRFVQEQLAELSEANHDLHTALNQYATGSEHISSQQMRGILTQWLEVQAGFLSSGIIGSLLDDIESNVSPKLAEGAKHGKTTLSLLEARSIILDAQEYQSSILQQLSLDDSYYSRERREERRGVPGGRRDWLFLERLRLVPELVTC